jgi:hypothetical protein
METILKGAKEFGVTYLKFVLAWVGKWLSDDESAEGFAQVHNKLESEAICMNR